MIYVSPSLAADAENLALVNSLEAGFPHIHKRLSFQWGSEDCRSSLHLLIAGGKDDRNGTRRGFPLDTLMLLMTLLAEHDTLFPQFVPIKTVFDEFR